LLQLLKRVEAADLPRFRANFTRGRNNMTRVNAVLAHLGETRLLS
jgi:hypothetical protein